MNKSKKYYEDHLRAMQSQKEEEEAEANEDKKKMLHRASMM